MFISEKCREKERFISVPDLWELGVIDVRLLSPCFVFCFLFIFVFLVLGATAPLLISYYFLSFLSSACTHITTARGTPHIFMKFKCRILRKICHFSIVWNCTKITGTLYGELCLFLLALLIIVRGCGWGGAAAAKPWLCLPIITEMGLLYSFSC